MHEHGIADRLMNQALYLAKQQGIARISRITIGLGALSGLDRESLEEPLRHVAEHCELAGVQFAFTKILPSAVCKKCGKNIGQAYQCPACGSMEIEITEGLEATVIKVQ